MEYLVVLLASALAGIGTGLVGLSAATAMVPLMIVLCPTFSGEHGAFMATAIALASDILGSAVTTAVYAKNKHIDLKHGWLIASCIIGMCTIGSIAAYYTHQSVLGSFSLFLCVAIGIRFLVKPDSKDRQSDTKGSVKLSVKEIIVSLFFGLTIGFGTGFFGSGGGMMMLIVFTAMLGYDRRTAVGTSTFIMTFTALIASVSHIMMEPAIILECWDYLLLSIVCATFFSLVSARFANRVNAKAVGYVTGAILLVLGLCMLGIQYRQVLPLDTILAFLKVFLIYIMYFVILAASLIVMWVYIRIPKYIFRKLLHGVAFFSILPLVLGTDQCWMAMLSVFIFLIVVCIALRLAESLSFYQSLFVEKAKHEVITSFILLFTLIFVLLGVFWGWMGDGSRYLAVAAIMAWGPGDAMAAIIGKNYGRHKLSGKMIEGVKSVEGTIAMGVTSLICTWITLVSMSSMDAGYALVVSLAVAPAAALCELFTKKGLDTITVPIISALILGLLC